MVFLKAIIFINLQIAGLNLNTLGPITQMQCFLCLMLVLWLENKTKIDHKKRLM